MRVAILTNTSEEDKKRIREKIDQSAEVIFIEPENRESRINALKIADIIYGGKLSEEELKIAINLKMHQTFATGVDRHNLKYYKDHNIILCNNHYHANIIAEYGFSMMLALSKELLFHDHNLRKGIWNHTIHRSFSLYGKTVVFVGYGKIAKSFKAYCAPFNMHFVAIKKNKKYEEQDVEIYSSEEKLDALKKGDIIFNSLPLTEETRNFIAKKEFEVMKSTAIVINVGRGPTINEEALYNALKKNKIKGAAIDVWYNYPKKRGENQEPVPCFPSKFPFQDLTNVIMTEHRAWQTDREWMEIELQLLDNVNRFIRKEKLQNIVDLDKGY